MLVVWNIRGKKFHPSGQLMMHCLVYVGVALNVVSSCQCTKTSSSLFSGFIGLPTSSASIICQCLLCYEHYVVIGRDQSILGR
jgi:hypothetical protein